MIEKNVLLGLGSDSIRGSIVFGTRQKKTILKKTAGIVYNREKRERERDI